MDLELEPYEEDLIVKLTPEEIAERTAKQAIEAPLVLLAHGETMAAEEDAWTNAKAARKAREKELEATGKSLVRALAREARILKAGEEERPVRCEDRIEVGPGNIDQVVTYRLDREPPEVVGKPRVATKDELKAWRAHHGIPEPEPVRAPGSKKAPEPAAEGSGHDPTDIAGALDRALPGICSKGRSETLVYKALEKAVPTSTPLDRKACIARNIEGGRLGEVDGKLLWAPQEPTDDGIVDNDYRPGAPH